MHIKDIYNGFSFFPLGLWHLVAMLMGIACITAAPVCLPVGTSSAVVCLRVLAKSVKLMLLPFLNLFCLWCSNIVLKQVLKQMWKIFIAGFPSKQFTSVIRIYERKSSCYVWFLSLQLCGKTFRNPSLVNKCATDSRNQLNWFVRLTESY